VVDCNGFLFQKALGEANEAKVEGNKLFVDGKYEEALSQYEHALQVAPDMPSSVEIRSICHSNRAVCFLKLVWPPSFILVIRSACFNMYLYFSYY
jgi:tetratricopeptide (TPR) repeat protein